jgi:hypothetical protein
LLLFEPGEVNHVEQVDGFAENKITALLQHKSQHRSTMGISSDESGTSEPDDLASFRQDVLDKLSEHGSLAEFSQGEAFQRLDSL